MNDNNELELGSESSKVSDKDSSNVPETQHSVEPPEPGKVLTIMTIGEESSEPMVVHTVGVVHDAPAEDTSNLVKVRIEYPAKWSRQKFFKDGETRTVSRETAQQFVKNKMAKIITDEKEAK